MPHPTSRSLFDAFPHSVKWKEIIFKFSEPVSPCFYDHVINLIEKRQLKVNYFLLPRLTLEEEEAIWNEQEMPTIVHSHYRADAPRICYALHQRGYNYDHIGSEIMFYGGKPDLLAIPCYEWWDCLREAKDKHCENCNKGNGLGFIPVEVGSLSFVSKIFTTRVSPKIKEFWLFPGKDYVYVFTCKRKGEDGYDPEAWQGWLNRIEEIVSIGKNRLNILGGRPCSEYPDCWAVGITALKRPCFGAAQAFRRKLLGE